MGPLTRGWAVVLLALRRLLKEPWLKGATLLGLVVTIALITSVPLYADAVYHRILRESLSFAAVDRDGARTSLPFLYRYRGAWSGPLEWAQIRPVDAYLSGPACDELRLPQRLIVRHVESDLFGLYPSSTAGRRSSPRADAGTRLASVRFATTSGLSEHVTLLEGRFPAAVPPGPKEGVEVLVSEALAAKFGLQVGDAYIAYAERETEAGSRTEQIPVRVAALWRATNPQDAFWFSDPEALYEKLFVLEEAYAGRIATALHGEVYHVVWYWVLDGADVHASDVSGLLYRIGRIEHRAFNLLRDTGLETSPAFALDAYRTAARRLTLALYVYSVPVIGLILAFLGLVVKLSSDRQRDEVAKLRSRGSSIAQVMGIVLVESTLLAALAMPVGLYVGVQIAHFVGRSSSFLRFGSGMDLRVEVTAATLRVGAAAAGLALLAHVLPSLGAARRTIVAYKQERVRALRPPWWQRYGLDLLLLVPAAYGARTLWRQGGAVGTSVDGGTANTLLRDPLLFLVPVLATLALTLLILRFLPHAMAGLAWAASYTRRLGLYLAARTLSRMPRSYSAPLILLTLTLSLAVYTASVARTVDRHLVDRLLYQTGADMWLAEWGERTGQSAGIASGAAAGAGPRWHFVPVSEHLEVPGVYGAARVGRYQAATHLGGGTQVGTYLGLDRVDFPGVAFWRADLSRDSLGALMNRLALRPNAVLVPYGYMGGHGLQVGDTLRVRVAAHGYRIDTGQRTDLDLEIVGGFSLFPTWSPGSGPLFVGNLDYLFERTGVQFLYDVWLKVDPQADPRQIAQSVQGMGVQVQDWEAPAMQVAVERRRPERQGLFGVLSVGFLAAATLTVLGFTLYAFYSWRRRFIELGVVRAIGLSTGQLTAFLSWELALLILTGAVAGTGLGVCASVFFVPHLQAGVGGTSVPPVLVQIAWPMIGRVLILFACLFGGAVIVLATLLARARVYEAIKLGEMA